MLFLIPIMLLAGCIPLSTAEPTATAYAPYRITPEDNPYAPRTSDLGMQIASVTITSINLSERFDLTPPRVAMSILGSMPSVCNELRVNVSLPDEDYRIFVEVYSLINPDVQCDNVFQQFEASILLGTYSSGRYTIWVNEGLVGDFVSN
ncbi:hypothetical protein FBQ99_19960 [Chloroflexi bacterium CFX2]|nr:hypothetical protein [Chloroflexi bacterium CFX2]